MAKKKILITGYRGLLGNELYNYFSNDFDVYGIDKTNFDICDKLAVNKLMESFKPMAVCHTAAYTDVDKAENEKEKVEAVNINSTEIIAHACKKAKSKLIYYSTDYVFNGEKNSPYIEDDTPDPINIYGHSKLEGERRVASIFDDFVIMRTSWLYGSKGKSFVRAIIKKGYEQIRAVQRGEIITHIKVVDDQIGNPTWTNDLAYQTKIVIENDLKGLYHSSANGDVSWYGLAKEIFELLNMSILLKPCKSDQYPQIAIRPVYSSLENRRLKELGLDVMRHYKIALSEFLTKKKDDLQYEI